MKRNCFTAVCLSLMLMLACVFPAFAYEPGAVDIFPELPETVKDYPYYVSYWDPLYETNLLIMFKEKPPLANITTEPVVNFLDSNRRWLLYGTDALQYMYIESEHRWAPYHGNGSLAHLDLRDVDLRDFKKSTYQNFSFDYSALPGVGFFPLAPFPHTELSMAVSGAKLTVLEQVASLVTLLLPLIICFMAFWKGWTWLKQQLLGV